MFVKVVGGFPYCADEGTRTPTSLRHKILSLARLPITTHPHKTGAKVQKIICLAKIPGSPAQFEVLSEINLSHMFVFGKLSGSA